MCKSHAFICVNPLPFSHRPRARLCAGHPRRHSDTSPVCVNSVPQRVNVTDSARAIPEQHPENEKLKVYVYDTTLRDGSQGEGISFTVSDKLKLAKRLDEFGVHYIEGGWPGSNPKDEEFFNECKFLQHAKLVAFGSTRYKNTTCELDRNVQALLRAETPVVTLVGKAWDNQVKVVLETSLEENIAMISETVAFFRARNREVMLDAEHFYDGYKSSPEYALSCLNAAVQAGVNVLVLCDTNGGTLPWDVQSITATVVHAFPDVIIGAHCHNDMELAVANSIAAVHAGSRLVQGTINGYGERTGNANLMSIVPTLQLKMGYHCLGERLQQLTHLSRFADEIANQEHVRSRPYVGSSSFAHKGGLHVAAVLKDPDTYQHIDPQIVGNERRILVSELSGKRNILSKAQELGLHRTDSGEDKTDWNLHAKVVLEQIKSLENKGYSFEGAEASLELMLRRARDGYRPPFELLDFTVTTDNKRVIFEDGSKTTPKNESVTQASVKLGLLGPKNGSEQCPTKICLEIAEGNGPVDAVNGALQKCLLPVYKPLRRVSLVDYKVRILDNKSGTAAITRVLVEFKDSANGKRWTTVYAHPNIIVASVNALMDGFEVAMWDYLPQCII